MATGQSSRGTRPWWMQPGCLLGGLITLVLVGGAIFLYFSFYQGRDISRVTGVPVKVSLPDCVKSHEQVLSISFHDKSSETIKDVTYVCDGRLFSQEYNDYGILQGSIEWTFNK